MVVGDGYVRRRGDVGGVEGRVCWWESRQAQGRMGSGWGCLLGLLWGVCCSSVGGYVASGCERWEGDARGEKEVWN